LTRVLPDVRGTTGVVTLFRGPRGGGSEASAVVG
jgi:hypothetical protein